MQFLNYMKDMPLTARAYSQDDRAVDTLADLAADSIRQRILSGELAPGLKLRVQELSQRLGFGLTPVREGLVKLVASGLVEVTGQKGFRVIPISLEDLEDIQMTRHLVEIEALRLAMLKGDIAWEGRIVAALHQLKSIGANARRFVVPWGTLEFDKAHKEFHAALISACGSPRLMGLFQELNDQIYRYRLVLKSSPRKKTDSDKDHENITRLVLARNFEGAAEAMHAHIDLTLHSLGKKPLEIYKQIMQTRSLG